MEERVQAVQFFLERGVRKAQKDSDLEGQDRKGLSARDYNEHYSKGGSDFTPTNSYYKIFKDMNYIWK